MNISSHFFNKYWVWHASSSRFLILAHSEIRFDTPDLSNHWGGIYRDELGDRGVLPLSICLLSTQVEDWEVACCTSL